MWSQFVKASNIVMRSSLNSKTINLQNNRRADTTVALQRFSRNSLLTQLCRTWCLGARVVLSAAQCNRFHFRSNHPSLCWINSKQRHGRAPPIYCCASISNQVGIKCKPVSKNSLMSPNTSNVSNQLGYLRLPLASKTINHASHISVSNSTKQISMAPLSTLNSLPSRRTITTTTTWRNH